MENLRDRAKVLRLTVDEKLSGDLIRLLVCPLVPNTDEFHDEVGEWEGESEILIGPANYLEVMGIPEDLTEKYPWETLREGQVFLSGRFAVMGDEEKPSGFTAGSEGRSFIRIDDVVRKRIKKLYFDALEGEKKSCRKE